MACDLALYASFSLFSLFLSINKTNQSLWRSSQLFCRKSAAFQSRPVYLEEGEGMSGIRGEVNEQVMRWEAQISSVQLTRAL
jgi:hypothetical protein